jgi:hypothetical protein
MKPTVKPHGRNTYHRDGTVSYWDTFFQSWRRKDAGLISNNTLATMSDKERARIARMVEVGQCQPR